MQTFISWFMTIDFPYFCHTGIVFDQMNFNHWLPKYLTFSLPIPFFPPTSYFHSCLEYNELLDIFHQPYLVMPFTFYWEKKSFSSMTNVILIYSKSILRENIFLFGHFLGKISFLWKKTSVLIKIFISSIWNTDCNLYTN